MLPDVTLDTFLPHVGQPFTARTPGGDTVALILAEASPAPGDSDARRRGRTAFSLIFRVAADHGLRQGTYVIEREGFGAVDVFLVPILPDREGMRIQAVFA